MWEKSSTFALQTTLNTITLCHKWLCWAARWFVSILPRKPLSIPHPKVAVGQPDTVVAPAASLLTSYPMVMNCWQLRAKACTTPLRRDVVGHRDIPAVLVVSFKAWWTAAENYLPKPPKASTTPPRKAAVGQGDDNRAILSLNFCFALQCSALHSLEQKQNMLLDFWIFL